MSCQPHRATSGWSLRYANVCFQTLLIYVTCKPFLVRSMESIPTQIWNKTYCIPKHQTQMFIELVPSILPLLKSIQGWYHGPFHLIYQYQVKKRRRKSKYNKSWFRCTWGYSFFINKNHSAAFSTHYLRCFSGTCKVSLTSGTCKVSLTSGHFWSQCEASANARWNLPIWHRVRTFLSRIFSLSGSAANTAQHFKSSL